MTKLAFIGAGNMSRSIIAGLIKQGFEPSSIMVSNPSPKKRKQLANEYRIKETPDNKHAAEFADVIVLSVKPHFIKNVCKEIATNIQLDEKCLVSVAAGITINQIQSAINSCAPTVRVMPNTPSLVGLGMTGLYASVEVSDTQKAIADQLMRSIGEVLWVDSEEKIDDLLSVSGSGPAYFFTFMEAMEAYALERGFSAEESRLLVQQTAIGAAQMVVSNDVEIGELRRNVTSKGGTTQAALSQFEQGNLQQLVTKAMTAALHRAKEIAQNNN